MRISKSSIESLSFGVERAFLCYLNVLRVQVVGRGIVRSLKDTAWGKTDQCMLSGGARTSARSVEVSGKRR